MRNFHVSQISSPRYYSAMKQNMYIASNQAAVATTAALATTWTGLGIANLPTNTKKAAILEFGWAQTVAGSADGAVGLMTATYASGFTAAITPRNRYTGSSNTSAMYVDDGATIATPVLEMVCGSLGTVAVTAYGTQTMNVVKLDGGLILNPGYCLLSYTTKATTASLIFYFIWEEF